ncbi:hypothetical protein FBY40_0243 [Microbacterium sp. SLBN-154]|uniref:hypothetical protein n=1 Tax=Microbacterium sp. SLBN-154 TaxID=2768458 RepID=UPI00114E7225|nr:hypothetical protein [Microbacterium sp. SLBN-154]TQK17766.1 hypothetical protein FBY40_0243 [Microbacterium sp. SLBN-154]
MATEPGDSDAAARARRKAERLKQWKQANPDKVKRYRDNRGSDASKARRRERDRARREKERADEERRAAARARARDWYAENRERHLEAQRQYRAAQRAADPDGFRVAKRERNKRWRDGHRDQENAKLREKYRADPEQKRAGAARYYENHAEKVKARRREYYARNRDAQLEKQRAWRAREKRRLDAGLPAYRVHRTAKAERDANRVAATTFFTRSRTTNEIETMLEELGTPAELLAPFQRDCARARAEYRHAIAPGRPEPAARSADRVAREREDERLDAIARAINDQLRHAPRNGSRASDDAPLPTRSHAQTREMGR